MEKSTHSHVVAMPLPYMGIRAVQLLLAIILLGLSAFLTSNTHSSYDFPASYGLTLFTVRNVLLSAAMSRSNNSSPLPRLSSSHTSSSPHWQSPPSIICGPLLLSIYSQLFSGSAVWLLWRHSEHRSLFPSSSSSVTTGLLAIPHWMS
jgi:hypothetical protein